MAQRCSSANAGAAGVIGSISELRRSPGGENGNPCNSIPTWKIPWTEEPSGLQSMGSQSQTRLKRLNVHAQLTIRLGRTLSRYSLGSLCCWRMH